MCSSMNMMANGITLNNLLQCALKKGVNCHYKWLSNSLGIKLGKPYIRGRNKCKAFNRCKQQTLFPF